jgi:hypothetical protein
VRSSPELEYNPARSRSPFSLRRGVVYFGFELETEVQPLPELPPELLGEARVLMAHALATGEARHPAVQSNRPAIEEVREFWRRSGGRTPRLGLEELEARYLSRLESQGVASPGDLARANLRLDLQSLVSESDRRRLQALPDAVVIRGDDVPVQYEVEDVAGGVARLRLQAKMARTLAPEEIPTLDRPVRFVVHRGKRGSVRADSLEQLQDELDRPWAPDEERSLRERHSGRKPGTGGKRGKGGGRGANPSRKGGPRAGRGGGSGRPKGGGRGRGR